MNRLLLLAAAALVAAGPLYAQTKISALPGGSAVTGGEAIPAVQSAATVSITPDQLMAYFDASPTFTGLVTAPALTISGITGSTQCLQASTAGVVSGTGSGCISAIAANSVLGNFTASTAMPIGNAIPSCSSASSALTYTTASGFGCNTISGSVPPNLTLTSPASAATFTLSGGKTFTVNNGLTLAGTDSTVMTFPTTSASVARTDAAQTFAGTQTFSSSITASAGLTASGVSRLSTITALTNAHVVQALNNPITLSGTGLGTSPVVSATTGSWTTEITTGSTPANATFTLTDTTASTGWTCSISDVTSSSSIVIGQTGFTPTTAVFQAYSRTTGATVALNGGDVLLANCAAF